MFLFNAFSFLLGIIVLSEISGDVADDFRQLTAQLPGQNETFFFIKFISIVDS